MSLGGPDGQVNGVFMLNIDVIHRSWDEEHLNGTDLFSCQIRCSPTVLKYGCLPSEIVPCQSWMITDDAEMPARSYAKSVSPRNVQGTFQESWIQSRESMRPGLPAYYGEGRRLIPTAERPPSCPSGPSFPQIIRSSPYKQRCS